MGASFLVSFKSETDAKKLKRLLDAWEGLYESFKEEQGNSFSFLICGDKSGLEVVRRNIKGGSWSGDMGLTNISDADKAISNVDKAAPSEQTQILINIPCIEASAEGGKISLPKALPAKIKKRIGPDGKTELFGWRVTYNKASIGLVFNVGVQGDRERLISAIAAGWNTWKVCQSPKYSTVQPDEIIPPDDWAEQYIEMKGLIDTEVFDNLEEIQGLKFKVFSKCPPPPDDFVVYDCAARSEDPWMVTLLKDGKESVIYDADKKQINEPGLKKLLLKTLKG